MKYVSDMMIKIALLKEATKNLKNFIVRYFKFFNDEMIENHPQYHFPIFPPKRDQMTLKHCEERLIHFNKIFKFITTHRLFDEDLKLFLEIL